MIKLLHANVFRLKKSKAFYLALLISNAFGLYIVASDYVSSLNPLNGVGTLESCSLSYSVLVGIVLGIFTSVFLGNDFEEGTIRNKVINKKRTSIYLANWLTIVFASILLYLAYIVPVFVFGSFFLYLPPDWSMFAFEFLCLLGVLVAYSSFFVSLAMTLGNKTSSLILAFTLAFTLAFAAFTMTSRLSESETIRYSHVNPETLVVEYEEKKNPLYLNEPERAIYQVLLDINPFGQAVEIDNDIHSHSSIIPLYSLFITIFLSSCGMIIFIRREIK